MAQRTLRGAGYKSLRELAGIVNDLAAAMNTLTAKLDGDTGITDVDYATTIGTQDTARWADGAPT